MTETSRLAVLRAISVSVRRPPVCVGACSSEVRGEYAYGCVRAGRRVYSHVSMGARV